MGSVIKGTALLEVLKPPDQRRSSSTSLLLDMCLSNEAPSFFAAQKVVAPAMGLSFCGVGYPSMKELMK